VKLHSFRLRIALLSALLAGSALVGFGGVSWWLIYQTKLNRIDDGIKDQLMRESDRPRPESHWAFYADALQITFSVDQPNDLALLVQNSGGKTVYQSPVWTAELTRVAIFPSRPASQQPATFPPPPFPRPDQFPPPRQEPPQSGQLGTLSDQRRYPPIPPPEAAPGMFRQPGLLPKLVTGSTRTGSWRVGTVTTLDVRIAIAINLHAIEAEMNAIRNAYLISIPLLLVLIAIGSWWLSGSALQPIREVTVTLRRVTAKGLDQRVPIIGSDREFVELLQVFNQMMERLERSFTQASRFSADAAHELKTPLSILQGELERTLQAAKPGSGLQQRLSSLLDEVRHLSAIVRKLLLLSLADAGQMRLYTTEVNLSDLLVDLVNDIEMLSPDLKVQVQVETALKVQADQALLIQVLQNLVSNATKYSLPLGWVKIEAGRRNQAIFVTVSNSSRDIPASERSRIFDRFHRGDLSRTHQVEGLGLGLSLSREIAYAHGGNLTLDSTPAGQTAFTLHLVMSLGYCSG
jgi:two-component system, OmpR family, heavy metal sensor histidine kinase CusS